MVKFAKCTIHLSLKWALYINNIKRKLKLKLKGDPSSRVKWSREKTVSIMQSTGIIETNGKKGKLKIETKIDKPNLVIYRQVKFQ